MKSARTQPNSTTVKDEDIPIDSCTFQIVGINSESEITVRPSNIDNQNISDIKPIKCNKDSIIFTDVNGVLVNHSINDKITQIAKNIPVNLAGQATRWWEDPEFISEAETKEINSPCTGFKYEVKIVQKHELCCHNKERAEEDIKSLVTARRKD